MKDTFCLKAWDELAVSPTGTFTPCCIFEDVIKNESGVPFNAWESSISEVWSSEYLKEIRRKMLTGEKVEACKQCYKIEDHKGVSPRLAINKYIEKDRTYQENEDQNPNHIDLKISNKCNLACRMCQPKDSNRVNSEFKKIIKNNKDFEVFENAALEDPFLNMELTSIPDWEESNHFLSEVSKLSTSLKSLCFAGGEPLIIKSFYEILEVFISNGKASEMTITLTTNLTNFPLDKIKRLIKEFDTVNFNVSIDATGREASYIRYPTDWDTLRGNIINLANLVKGTKSMIYFSPTVQVYNVIYVDKVFEFIESLYKEKIIRMMVQPLTKWTICYIVNLTYPKHLNLNTLPEEARVVAISRLENFLKESKYLTRQVEFKKNLEHIISVLKNDYAQNYKEHQSNFLYYTELLDMSRKQKMRDYLPLLYSSYMSTGRRAHPPSATEEFKGRKLSTLRGQGWKLANERKYKEAIEYFTKSYETGLDKFIDLLEIGWMNNAMGNPSEALGKYKEAIEIKPNDFIALRELGATHMYCQNYNEAKQFLLKAKEIQPSDVKTQELLQEINKG